MGTNNQTIGGVPGVNRVPIPGHRQPGAASPQAQRDTITTEPPPQARVNQQPPPPPPPTVNQTGLPSSINFTAEEVKEIQNYAYANGLLARGQIPTEKQLVDFNTHRLEGIGQSVPTTPPVTWRDVGEFALHYSRPAATVGTLYGLGRAALRSPYFMSAITPNPGGWLPSMNFNQADAYRHLDTQMKSLALRTNPKNIGKSLYSGGIKRVSRQKEREFIDQLLLDQKNAQRARAATGDVVENIVKKADNIAAPGAISMGGRFLGLGLMGIPEVLGAASTAASLFKYGDFPSVVIRDKEREKMYTEQDIARREGRLRADGTIRAPADEIHASPTNRVIPNTGRQRWYNKW